MKNIYNVNNLDKAHSPYLKQHKINPIHWQEWTKDVLEYAQKENKILFVSVGYSTCHWCHVMAHKTFSDTAIADFLNKHFVSIKVDREQRPDIDQYLMEFLMSTAGQGGWPLNVFLTPDRHPFRGLTYAGATSEFGLPSFLDILTQVKTFHDGNKDTTQSFKPMSTTLPAIQEEDIVSIIWHIYDKDYAGFGYDHKFPPHCTLLFMIHYFEETHDKLLRKMIEETLDMMVRSGLHDHLQGGFFRYCVDRQWNVPHFEKMLYDQALLLWIYSLAYKLFKKEIYKITAEKIINCLNETFMNDGLFYSAHDADTDHEEGATYLWLHQELKNILSEEEFATLDTYYALTTEGNFEGKNHLIKKTPAYSKETTIIEEKLLQERRKRKQPFLDTKIITSWNALVGIAFIHAYRYLGTDHYLQTAEKLLTSLLKAHYDTNRLIHSSLDNLKQKEEFLEDYAAFLLFLTYFYEETGSYKEHLETFYDRLRTFKKNDSWIESDNDDFMEVFSKSTDHPTPSSVSLAELALVRYRIVMNTEEIVDEKFREPLNYDFLNISVLIKRGLFHTITSPLKLKWQDIPLNSIQVKGETYSNCYKGVCGQDPTTSARNLI